MNRDSTEETIRKKWLQTELETPAKQIDAQKLWARLDNRPRQRTNYMLRLAMAAAVIAVVATGIALLPNGTTTDGRCTTQTDPTQKEDAETAPERLCIDVNIVDPMYTDANYLYPACLQAGLTEPQINN